MTKFYFEQQGNNVAVKLNSDVLINAWEGAVVLPEGLVTGRIITAGSMSEIWQTTPRQEGNKIIFTGGKPNGFSSDGVLFKFIIVEPGRYNLQFSSQTTAYLNDGSGARAEATLATATLIVEPAEAREIITDTVQPQPFRPAIFQSEQFFNGQPVALFSADDFESGISHYEIREHTGAGVSGWHKAVSPYLIQPDVKKLEIKAVDNFGNERIESLIVSKTGPELTVAIIIVIAIVIAVLIVYNTIKRWRTIGSR